ncbi:MBL fold metallo-hydrolase [Christiangramia sabulilitoris]|uniref:MBL fold metallo-hydrolase n=1 Tax=Christiangramia sabulilitoris TaxID=2583991 RepID=A0A550I7G8_9FLAO|nr:MBL fold metallo-hydrolase [Christiangramia sabulilitoris]TRO66915.1 MBL fold metallo-hydrolase [Christiangramia sabulilitoris]
MKRIAALLTVGILLSSCKNEAGSDKKLISEEVPQEEVSAGIINKTDSLKIEITPVSHATGVFKWDDTVFYTDPTGGANAFSGMEKPDFILVTDIHGDHMNAETLNALDLGSTKIVVPKAVQEKLPEELQANLVVINNGESTEIKGFKIEAIPMYNIPETKDAMHVKGRGNGYVIEKNGQRLYISGDTEDIPEMRDLKNIDIALVSMNLPYTMPVDQAAEGVLAFKPKKVIPYHYRGKEGFADIEEFKKLVNKGNAAIEVELMNWYPEN